MTKNTARKFTVPQSTRDIPIKVRTYLQGNQTIVEARVGSSKLHLSGKEATELAQELQDALNGQESAK